MMTHRLNVVMLCVALVMLGLSAMFDRQVYTIFWGFMVLFWQRSVIFGIEREHPNDHAH